MFFFPIHIPRSQSLQKFLDEARHGDEEPKPAESMPRHHAPLKPFKMSSGVVPLLFV